MMDWKDRIAVSVLNGLGRCFKQNLFTDIEIEVNSIVFKCHKIFLCAISDFFHAMFQSGMKESVDNRIQLSGLSDSAFRNVLTFYYEGDEDVITHDTADELLRASGLLQLECLQTRCEEYYGDHLVADNALGIWKLATCLGCSHLQQEAREFILQNFESVSQEAEFISLEVEPLLDLVGDSDLKVSSEDVVCMAVTKWIQHDLSSRSQHLDALVSQLCLPMLSAASYANLQEVAKFTGASCSTLLPENPHQLPSAGTSSELSVGRCCRNYEEMLVAIGIHRSTKMLPYVHAYSFSQAAWYHLRPLPFDPGVGYATCVAENAIYMSGISLRRGYMLRYDVDVNVWEEVMEMPDRRRYHELVVMGEHAYAVGGCNKREGACTRVTRYSVEDDEWETAGQLQLGVYSASAAPVHQTILVFGGRAHGSLRRSEIQAFDTRTGTCSILSSFSSPVTESRALTLNDEAFVAWTNGTVMKVSETGDIYPLATLLNFDRYNFGFVRRLGRLLVVGGDTRYPSGSGSGHFGDFIQVEPGSGDAMVLGDKLYPAASAACCCLLILRRTSLQPCNK